MKNLSFVTMLSYDYIYAFEAIAKYYDIADEIILGIDKDRITWSGNSFEFDQVAFNDFLLRVDTDNKIRVLSGNYHEFLRPIDNDTYERNHLSSMCKTGNWIFQIDADEIMLNKIEFKQFMQDNTLTLEGFAIKAHWITVFKTFENGNFLVIDADSDTDGRIFVGTKSPNAYTMCRDTAEPAIQSPLRLLHISWGRSREELKKKLENWGHSTDFDTTAYLEMWDTVTLENYKSFKDIHPLHGPHWPKLKLVEFDQIMHTQGEPNAV